MNAIEQTQAIIRRQKVLRDAEKCMTVHRVAPHQSYEDCIRIAAMYLWAAEKALADGAGN